jgi:hypothetical protein
MSSHSGTAYTEGNDLFATGHWSTIITSNSVNTYYDSVRNFGITSAHTYGLTSMKDLAGCTQDFKTYTPVYEGPTTLIQLNYVFDPASTTDFRANIDTIAQGFTKPDHECVPTSYTLVPMPNSLTDYD